MNSQIIALIMGILALLVSLLELFGEINKKRMLATSKKGNDLFVPLPKPPSHLADNESDTIPGHYHVDETISRQKDDIIRLYESCSTEQRATFLQYLQNKQLAEMDRNGLYIIWWFFLGLFQRAYSCAEHRRSRATKEKLAD